MQLRKKSYSYDLWPANVLHAAHEHFSNTLLSYMMEKYKLHSIYTTLSKQSIRMAHKFVKEICERV
jgi:hypothetical protein